MTDPTLHTLSSHTGDVSISVSARELIALLQTDQRTRWERGDLIRVETYLEKYPGLGENVESVLALVQTEVSLRTARGETPRLEEYQQRLPRFAEALERSFSARKEPSAPEPQSSSPPGETLQPEWESHRAQLAATQESLADRETKKESQQLAETLVPSEALPFTEDYPHQQFNDTIPPRKESIKYPRQLPGLPGYEILGELGRGGMGVVYKARQKGLKRLVALKMILQADHAGRHERERFQREAEAIAHLKHENIVQVYEVGEAEGKPFFSLEFVEGGSLDRRVQATPQPPNEAAGLVEKLARAMYVAHQAGIIHRDLKPANVLLAAPPQPTAHQEGKDGPGLVDLIPKITDFGLAKKLDEASQTQSGAIMGTPSYMATEQAAGKHNVIGPPTDIYALGAILYDLLTGHPPFKAVSAMDTVLQVLNEEPVPPRRLQPNVPRDLETICLKCLEKEPRKRYGSALELAEDLRRFQAGEPVQARPVGALERAWRWCRRNPLVASLLTAVVVVLLGGITISTAFGVLASKEADRATKNAREAEKQTERATKNAREAEKQTERANIKAAEEAKAREEAEEARKQETLQKERAEKQWLRSEWLLYGSQVALAQREWQDNQTGHARELLHGVRWDYRGWECDYLHTLFNHRQQDLQGHTNAVNGLAYSRDGKYLATASSDKSIKVWDTTTHENVLTLLPWGNNSLSDAAFSPDGKWLAASGWDRIVQIWDAGQRGVATSPVRTLRGHTGPVSGVVFSPDGRLLASSSWDKSVRVWDTENWKSRHVLQGHTEIVDCVAFSPDGKLLASAGADRNVLLWDMDTGKQKQSLAGHTGRVRKVEFAPDGQRLASAADNTVRLWDLSSGKVVLTLDHPDQVRAVAFSRDGKQLASGGNSGVLTGWDTHTGVQLFAWKGHQGAITDVAFRPDGNQLASCENRGGGRSSVAKLWDPKEAEMPLTLRDHPGGVKDVVFNDKGNLLATVGTDKTVKLWKPGQGYSSAKPTLLFTLEGHTGPVDAAAFGDGGQRLVTSAESLRVWDTHTGKELLQIAGGRGAVAFSPDGRLLASGHARGHHTIELWDASTGKNLGSLKGHLGAINSLVFHPKGKYLASASGDKTIRLWDVKSGKEFAVLRGHLSHVTQITFSKDGRRLASASADRTVRVWDLPEERQAGAVPPTLTLHGHTNNVAGVAFSPDGTRIASCSFDYSIKVWNVELGLETCTIRLRSPARDLAFSSDGEQLVAGLADGTLQIWTAAPSAHPDVLNPGSQVNALAYSPDGTRLAAVTADGLVRVWDVHTGKQTEVLQAIQTGYEDSSFRPIALAFSPDGKRLAAAGVKPTASVALTPDGKQVIKFDDKKTLKVWDLEKGKVILTLPGHGSVSWSQDGQFLAAASGPKGIALWDTQTGRQTFTLEAGDVLSVVLSLDGKLLAGGMADGTVKVWNVAKKSNPLLLQGHRGGVFAVAFGPAGRLASAGADGIVPVWDLQKGQPVYVLQGHQGVARSVAFSRDGKHLLSGGGDSTVKLWDAVQGKMLVSLNAHAGPVTSVVFDPGGKGFASASETVKVWRFAHLEGKSME
jgi:WD40 repeat protein/serine/threonine protein kinase